MSYENGFVIILIFIRDGVEWSENFVDRFQLLRVTATSD